ncbi:DNA polymerase III subunit beta [Dethiobacter alkaliphilus]|uniref:DNA polymerase III subunit beta n=1 Tax=Dethiobacter alkaliphilus TaxID=427926 RepID=UPI00222773EB|nr:DNA polymerase III subunit beta [Dethiobacter alkaliphilus]MCW3488978.1 DNA polymerase III subunit beta [Dethiobacter alkaliphilus]
MRLTVPKALLAEHLQITAKAAPPKSTTPVLEGILFQSDGQTMTLTATNLEMGIRTSFPVPDQEKGEVVLPAKAVEIIRKLPGDTVSLTVNEENFLTEIKSGQSEFQLYGLSTEEYPAFADLSADSGQYACEIKAGEFRRALRQTLFAASQDEGKPAFTGIMFTLKDNTLTLSSSDTFRLATTSCRVQNQGADGIFLVPAKNLQEVIRILTDDEDSVQLAVADNQLLITCKNIKLSSRLLDENFPNIDRVIPREFSGRATVDVADFLHAVERASLLSEGVNHVVRLSIGEEGLVIRASSKFGKTQEHVPVELSGEGLEISLNSRFILDMLKVHEGDQCILELTNANKPCILRDSLYQEYLYLVLPIKI